MSYKIDLDGLLSELRSRVVGDHSSVVLDDVIESLKSYFESKPIEHGFKELNENFDFNTYVGQINKSSASKLNQHGKGKVESALSDVIPSSLLLVGIIGSFVIY